MKTIRYLACCALLSLSETAVAKSVSKESFEYDVFASHPLCAEGKKERCDLVHAAFKQELSRKANLPELAFWVPKVASGVSKEEIARTIRPEATRSSSNENSEVIPGQSLPTAPAHSYMAPAAQGSINSQPANSTKPSTGRGMAATLRPTKGIPATPPEARSYLNENTSARQNKKNQAGSEKASTPNASSAASHRFLENKGLPAGFGAALQEPLYNPMGPITSVLKNGTDDALALGIPNFKIHLSRATLTMNDTFYRIHGLDSRPINSLVELAKQPEVRHALSAPFKAIFIDADNINLDQRSPTNTPAKFNNYWDFDTQRMQEVDRKAVFQETYDFAAHLLQEYKGTGRTFVIQNHEGDSHTTTDAHPHNLTPTDIGLANFRDYWEQRQAAIEKARKDHPSDVKIFHMCEIVRVNKVLDNENHPDLGKSLLRDVLSQMTCDLVGYSAHDTAINGDGGVKLRQAIALIKRLAKPSPTFGTNNVVLSEIGVPENISDGYYKHQTNRVAQVIKDLLNEGMPWVIYWQLYDNGFIGNREDKIPHGNFLRRPDGSLSLMYLALAGSSGGENEQAKCVDQKLAVPSNTQNAAVLPEVSSMYDDVLGGIGNHLDGARYLSQLAQNGYTLSSLRADLVREPATRELINNLYISYLGRQATSAELSEDQAALKGAASLRMIEHKLKNHSECRQKNGAAPILSAEALEQEPISLFPATKNSPENPDAAREIASKMGGEADTAGRNEETSSVVAPLASNSTPAQKIENSPSQAVASALEQTATEPDWVKQLKYGVPDNYALLQKGKELDAKQSRFEGYDPDVKRSMQNLARIYSGGDLEKFKKDNPDMYRNALISVASGRTSVDEYGRERWNPQHPLAPGTSAPFRSGVEAPKFYYNESLEAWNKEFPDSPVGPATLFEETEEKKIPLEAVLVKKERDAAREVASEKGGAAAKAAARACTDRYLALPLPETVTGVRGDIVVLYADVLGGIGSYIEGARYLSGLVEKGHSLDSLRGDLVKEPAVRAKVNTLFKTYLNRDVADNEYESIESSLRGSGTLRQVEMDLLKNSACR